MPEQLLPRACCLSMAVLSARVKVTPDSLQNEERCVFSAGECRLACQAASTAVYSARMHSASHAWLQHADQLGQRNGCAFRHSPHLHGMDCSVSFERATCAARERARAKCALLHSLANYGQAIVPPTRTSSMHMLRLYTSTPSSSTHCRAAKEPHSHVAVMYPLLQGKRAHTWELA